MTRLATLLAALGLLATVLVAAAPTASAISCQSDEEPQGGLVGRTVEYVDNVSEAVCAETVSYYSDVCVLLVGPSSVCYPR